MITLEIDQVRLIYLIVGSCAVAAGIALASRGPHQRTMLSGFFIGLILYSGIGTTDLDVPSELISMLFVFSGSVILGFSLGKYTFSNVAPAFGNWVEPALEANNYRSIWKYIIAIYIALHIADLVIPTFRIHHLFSPPSPDIKAWLYNSVFKNTNATSTLIEYGKVLISPFFYIALYHYRGRLLTVATCLLLVVYVEYVSQSYIGRSDILVNLLLFFCVAFFLTPKGPMRTITVASMIAAAPLILIGFQAYMSLRLGVAPGATPASSQGFAPLNAAAALANSEFTFLEATGTPLIESGRQIDLKRYLVWIITLPIPSFLKQDVDIALVNYELSEVVLWKNIGEDGWYVVLPGLLAESVYIYGKHLYWIHGIFVGFTISLLTRICEKSPHLTVLFFYLTIMMSYNLNRGGIASVLPVLVNSLLLFALVSFALIMRRNSTSTSPLRQP